ncbi:MAG: hypothetical protein KDA59_04440 [Planctomycetales bacterium]|nr:hypothetical protein [Planctomycetales bacterium]
MRQFIDANCAFCRHRVITITAMAALAGVTTVSETAVSQDSQPARGRESVLALEGTFTSAIVAVNLSSSAQVTDEALDQLLPLRKDLRRLNLKGTKLTDSGVYRLRQFTELTELDLSGTGITDDGLEYLGELAQLRELRLSDTHITGTGIVELAGIRQLELLDLARTRIGDESLRDLRTLRNLRTLSLSGCPVSGNSMKELARCKNLRHLDLSNTQLDHLYREIHFEVEFWGLETLIADGTLLRDDGLGLLEILPTLKQIGVANTHVSGKRIVELMQYRGQSAAKPPVEKLHVGRYFATNTNQLASDDMRAKILDVYPKIEIISIAP